MPQQRALISVYDKRMLVDFARGLVAAGFEIVATPGTRQALREAGLPIRSISEFTGTPEVFGGRIRTLHQSIFAGILARRTRPEHLSTLEEQQWPAIDMVVVNLAPAREATTPEELAEQMDPAGPGLIRAAAKNHADVIVLTNPNDYEPVLRQLREGGVGLPRRRLLALKALSYLAAHDHALSQSFAAATHSGAMDSAAAILPASLNIEARWRSRLRCGDNPHQAAALYQDEACLESSIPSAELLSGGDLTYQQVADLDVALEIAKDFDEPLTTFVRHGNPCGLARAEQLADAFVRALDCDPLSVAGSVVAVNRAVDEELAPLLLESNIKAIVAPAYRASILEKLTARRDLTLLRTGPLIRPPMDVQIRPIIGGFLVQDRDLMPEGRRNWRVATELEPTPEDLEGMIFAWRVVKWVRSCGVAITDSNCLLAAGSGQTNLLDAARIALEKAGNSADGAYLAADDVFGMAEGLDVLDLAHEAGIRGIIQPGGGPLDAQAARAADERGLAMVFTGRRHLRH